MFTHIRCKGKPSKKTKPEEFYRSCLVASLPRLPGLLIDKYPGREVGQGRAAPGGFNLDREAPCPWYDGKTGRKKHHKKTKAGPLPCSPCSAHRSVLDQPAIEARTPLRRKL